MKQIIDSQLVIVWPSRNLIWEFGRGWLGFRAWPSRLNWRSRFCCSFWFWKIGTVQDSGYCWVLLMRMYGAIDLTHHIQLFRTMTSKPSLSYMSMQAQIFISGCFFRFNHQLVRTSTYAYFGLHVILVS